MRQYRDGDTLQLVLTFTNNAGTRIINLTIANGNITTQTSSLLGTQEVITYETCNSNIYCDLPDVVYDITGVTVEGVCPPPPLGEACEIYPRLGEPGFSVKNCDDLVRYDTATNKYRIIFFCFNYFLLISTKVVIFLNFILSKNILPYICLL